MKRIQKFSLLALTLLATIAFTGCKDDDILLNSSPTPNPGPNPNPAQTSELVGEWLEDLSDGNQIIMSTSEFTSDGKYKSWAAIIMPGTNIYGTEEGTYTFSGNTIKVNYKSMLTGQMINSEFTVQKLDAYTLNWTQTEGSVSTRRIIGTYNMAVGESKAFAFDDANFVPSSYKSCDEKVATVSATGTIQAVKRGTTFIRVTAPVGEVAVRVVVTDENHAVDDYVQYAAGSVEDVKAYYGTPSYAGVMSSNGNQVISYDLNDDMINSITFYYNRSNHIYYILAMFQEGADIAPVIAEFDKKYEKRTAKDETYHIYKTKVDGETLTIAIDEEFRSITYIFQDPFEDIDGLYRLDAEHLAKAVGHEFNNEEDDGNFSGYIEDNEYFSNVLVRYDPETLAVQALMFYAQEGFTQEEIEEWYKKNYIYNEQTGYYLTTDNMLTSECMIKVATNERTGRVTVTYMKR